MLQTRKLRRRDSDDRERYAFDVDGLAQNGGICGKSPRPKRMTQDRNLGMVLLVIASEHAPADDFHTQS